MVAAGDDDAWLALLDDASEPSAELLSALFGSDDGDDNAARVEQAPSLLPALPAKKQPRKRSRTSATLRSHLLRLRLEATDLENVYMLLQQRHVALRCLRGTSSESSASTDSARRSPLDSDSASTHAWKAAASRQLQRRRAATLENQQLRSALQQQTLLAEQLVRLLRRAQRGLPPAPVPRPLVHPDVVALSFGRRAELLDLAWHMASSVDAVVADAALRSLEDEFSHMTVDDDVANRREIPCGTVLGGAVARRLMPCAPQSIADHMWKPRSVNYALSSIEYNEQTSETQVTHYTITVPQPTRVLRLLGVSVRVRVRDKTRDAVVSIGSMWPDADMPYPFNAIGYTSRDWMVAQRDPHAGDYSNVVVKTERERFVHAQGAAAVTPEEAAALRDSVKRANAIALKDVHQRLDALLLGDLSRS